MRRNNYPISKWYYYIIDLSDIRNPKYFKYPFLLKEWAVNIRNKHFPKFFSIIDGFEFYEKYFDELKSSKPLPMDISKYDIPPEYHYDKVVFKNKRTNIRRQELRRINRKTKFNKKLISEIIEHKPMRFCLRASREYYYQDIYYKKEIGLAYAKETFIYPYDVVCVMNIRRVLEKYYDCGPYWKHLVAGKLYKTYHETISKLTNWKTQYLPERKAENELRERGFIDLEDYDYDFDNCSYIITNNNLKTKLIYPRAFNYKSNDPIKDEEGEIPYIYDAQRLYGLPPYTMVQVSRKNE